MHRSHQVGQISETILTEWLLRRDYYVARPTAGQGPVDIVAYNEKGQIILLDSKTESTRVNTGRKNPTRIYRALSPIQKRLGVRIAYVDQDTREVNIVPPLED